MSLVSCGQHFGSHDNTNSRVEKDFQQSCFTGLKTYLPVTLKTRENTANLPFAVQMFQPLKQNNFLFQQPIAC